MTEQELRQRLRATVQPDSGAEAAAWEVVRAVFDDRPVSASRRRPARGIVVVAACLVAVAVIVLAAGSQPREALARWLRHTIGVSSQPVGHPNLTRLPGGGRLLVDSPIGPWVVHADGSRRYLGHYTAASWSPHGLFIVAWRASQLVAIDPLGHPRWALDRAGPVKVARWSPDGYRIAYVAGRSLRVVAGDGSGDHLLLADVAPVAPAWRPAIGQAHVLAFVDGGGELQARDTDTGALLWRLRPAAPPRQLLWTAEGSALLVVASHQLSLYGPSGRLLASTHLAPGATSGQATLAATGDRVALILDQAGTPGASIVVLTASRSGLRAPARVLFSGPAAVSQIAWSPDGRWLLAASPAADQWIFVRIVAPAHLSAVSHVANQFEPGAKPPRAFPVLAGWQR